jgi:hypothetical protein
MAEDLDNCFKRLTEGMALAVTIHASHEKGTLELLWAAHTTLEEFTH